MKIFFAQQTHGILSRIILYTISCALLMPICVSAQHNSLLSKGVTVEFKNVKLSDALQELERRVGCSFVYSNQLLNSDQQISRQYKNERLDYLIMDLIAKKGIKLKQNGNQIFIGLSSLKKQTLSGKITSKGDPAIGVSVSLGMIRAKTDVNGKYELSATPNLEYILHVSGLGYKTISRSLILNEFSPTVLNLELQSDDLELGQVIVTGKTANQTIRESGFNVTALDVGKLNNTTKDINQILNTTTGVRIREQGGLGSDFNFSLNGLSGKAVRFFIDGIPTENYGVGMTLNNIPVNLADRLEVYKGVVPIELGSDALGGAVNMVTNKGNKSYLDASYSVGSFNTHRASINAQSINDTSGLLIKLTGFYNYSDNNYWMHSNSKYDAPILVPDGEGNFVEKSVKRFHDQYKSAMLQGEVGFVKRKWADALVLGILYNNHYKEYQTGARQSAVYGRLNRQGDYVMPSLRYKKHNFLNTGFSVSAFLSYGIDKYSVADTSSTTYWWDGSIRSSNNKHGELGPSTDRSFTNYQKIFLLSRLNISYKINGYNELIFSQNYNNSGQKADEELSQKAFSTSGQSKSITGLSLQNIASDNQLNTTIFVKLFQFDVNIGEIIGGKNSRAAEHKDYLKLGYGMASRYRLNDYYGIRFSYEHAYRLPELIEVLGDGVNIIPNLNIKPENSHNLNAGIDFTHQQGAHSFRIDLSGFFRNAQDFIYTIPAGNNSFQYLNEGKVLIFGSEAEANYKYENIFEITLNASYQKSKQNQKYIYGTGTPRETYGNMIPNQPWLFGNLHFSIGKNDWLTKRTRLQFDWSSQYFHSFYLTWKAWGSAQSLNIIPRQLLHNAAITYSLKEGRYNISFETKNIGNQLAYDNFRLQRPGRSFNLKFRYFLH